MPAIPTSSEATVATGTLLTRLPGRARAAKDALREFEEEVARLRSRYLPAVWPIFIPNADDMFRWRVQLECGCVHEVYTRGKDDFPDEHTRTDPLTQEKLPQGEFWCPTEHDAPRSYREIAEWVTREVKEFPPDPEDPKDVGVDPEIWAIMRRTEPHSSAFWTVRLSCGHAHKHVVTAVEWKPEDGPQYWPATRIAEIRQDYDEYWAKAGPEGYPPAGPERDHVRRMLDLGWPRPEPEQDCRSCRYASRITGYQRVGWLIPRTKPKTQAAKRDNFET